MAHTNPHSLNVRMRLVPAICEDGGTILTDGGFVKAIRRLNQRYFRDWKSWKSTKCRHQWERHSR
jgi:hypothetical protein